MLVVAPCSSWVLACVLGVLLVGLALLVPLHIDLAEVELGDGDSALFYHGAGPPDRWVLTQAVLREEPVVLLFQSVRLLAVLVRFL